jgi:3-phosphoshikimate 1-carboxyvinyltransferase
MQTIKIAPARRLYGRIGMPGDKSISHRAIMLGAIARGRTVVKGLLDCDDCRRTVDAFRSMGVGISLSDGQAAISGVGLSGLKAPKAPIDAGDSGTTVRILSGLLAGQKFDSVLTGSEGLSKRPMERVIEPLSLMGVSISGRRGRLPITISGGDVRGIKYRMDVPSAQVKSAILFAGLYADGPTTVEEPFRSRDHTERMMEHFGARIKVEGLKTTLRGRKELTGRSLEVPGDISSASFFIAAATLVKGSKVRIDGVSLNPTRTGVLSVLSRMGAKFRVIDKVEAFEPSGDIEVEHAQTRGTVIEPREIPLMIDELPVIFVTAALSKGRTVIKGAGELRVKETDRIASMKENIAAMGGRVSVSGDEIVIDGVDRLKGARLRSFGDHRTAMSMAVAAAASDGPSVIEDPGCVSKSFPAFFRTLEGLRPKE